MPPRRNTWQVVGVLQEIVNQRATVDVWKLLLLLLRKQSVALIEDRQHTQDRSEEMSRWFHCAISTQFNGHYGNDRTKAYMQTALTTNERGRVDDKWTLNFYFPNQYPYSFILWPRIKRKLEQVQEEEEEEKLQVLIRNFETLFFPVTST